MQKASNRKVTAGVAALAGLALISCLVWWPARFHPDMQLPAGVSLGDVLRAGQTNAPKGWRTNDAKACFPKSLPLWARIEIIGLEAREAAYDAAGKSLLRVPPKPALDFLEPRLREAEACAVYLVAREFFGAHEANTNLPAELVALGVIYGSPTPLKHDRDRIRLIEQGLLENGLITYRIKFRPKVEAGQNSVEYLYTNRCAIIRDTPGVVKIVPLDCLKSYAAAGLVELRFK